MSNRADAMAEAQQYAGWISPTDVANLAYELEYVYERGVLPDDAYLIEHAEQIGDTWLIVLADPGKRQ